MLLLNFLGASRPSCWTTNASRSSHSTRVIAQTSVDAKLHAGFEEYGASFDYSSSVRITGEEIPRSDKVTTAYLHQIQKGKFIQPFGCLLALDDKSLKVIAYSEDAPDMIVDCRAKHVKVLQDVALPLDLTLCGSTLRAPHSCHLQYMENMGSIASLVMAAVINDTDEDVDSSPDTMQPQRKRKRLWGLVVCHNSSPRFVPFPLRYACELVKCDGAALLYKNKAWKLGVTPVTSSYMI